MCRDRCRTATTGICTTSTTITRRERGVPALLALLWLLGRAFYDFVRTLRGSPDSECRWVLYAALAVMIAVMLSGYEEVNLGDSEVLAMFLAVVACGYVAVMETGESRLKPRAA